MKTPKSRVRPSLNHLAQSTTVKTFAPSLQYNTLICHGQQCRKQYDYNISDELVQIDIAVEEGKKYYFGDITFIENTKYETELLSGILKINRGDIYDSQHLNERVSFDPNGNDVASIYLNNGYLFSQVIPVGRM